MKKIAIAIVGIVVLMCAASFGVLYSAHVRDKELAEESKRGLAEICQIEIVDGVREVNTSFGYKLSDNVEHDIVARLQSESGGFSYIHLDSRDPIIAEYGIVTERFMVPDDVVEARIYMARSRIDFNFRNDFDRTLEVETFPYQVKATKLKADMPLMDTGVRYISTLDHAKKFNVEMKYKNSVAFKVIFECHLESGEVIDRWTLADDGLTLVPLCGDEHFEIVEAGNMYMRWQLYEQIFEAPSGTNRIRLRLEPIGEGSMEIDAATFEMNIA